MNQFRTGVRFCCFILLIFLGSTGHALDLNLPVSAEQFALNGLSILAEESACSTINPTLIYPGITISSSNLYSISDLLQHQVSAAMKWGIWGIAAGCTYLNYSTYREIQASTSIALQYRKLRTGLNGRYLHNQIDLYHQSGKLILDAALFWSSPIVETTVLYKNLLNLKMLDTYLPVSLIWESRFMVTEKVKLGIGLEKQLGEEFIFKLGTRYDILDYLSLLISCQNEPARLGMGIICRFKKLKFVYGIQTHQYLPYTHSVSLIYEIFAD
jgi:hypothetical protein